MSEVKFQISGSGIKELLQRGLTKRQLEIVEAMTQNSTHKQIAEKLFISDKTVKFHLTLIYMKLKVKNKAELLMLIYQWLERKEEPNKGLPIGSKC